MIVALCAWFVLIFTAGLRRDPESGRQDALTFVYFLTFSILGFALQALVIYLRPTTYDAQFLMADRALGMDPLAVIHWIGAHPHLGDFLGLMYEALPVVMVFTWAVEQNLILRRAMFVGGYLCFVFYLLLPAVGPGVYDWTANVPAHGQMMLWRNCMPSMHFGWTLLMARNSRNKFLIGFLWIFAGLTAVSTIVVGQHYFIDLIAAVPYVIMVQWITENVHFRRRAELLQVEDAQFMPSDAAPSRNLQFDRLGIAKAQENSQQETRVDI